MATKKAAKPKRAKRYECPNCLTKGLARPRDACVLEACAMMLVDRGVATPEAAMAWLATQDADGWWDEIGPVVDLMESAFVKDEIENAEHPDPCGACGNHPAHVSDKHQIGCTDQGKTMCADHHSCDGEGA